MREEMCWKLHQQLWFAPQMFSITWNFRFLWLEEDGKQILHFSEREVRIDIRIGSPESPWGLNAIPLTFPFRLFAQFTLFLSVAFRSICQMSGNKIYLGPCSNSNHIVFLSTLERFPNIAKAQHLGPMTAPRSTSLFLRSKSAFGRLSPNCQALLELWPSCC